MTNEQLLSYVRNQLATGASKQVIAQSLVAGDWTAVDIAEAFAMVEKDKLVSPAPSPVLSAPPIPTEQPQSVVTASSVPSVPVSPPTSSIPESAAPVVTIYAGFWRRVLAGFLDIILVYSLLSIFVLFPLSLLYFTNSPIVALILVPSFMSVLGALILVGFLYQPLCESSHLQGSFGKKLLGLSVTDMAGNKISFLRAFGRNLAKCLSSFFCIGYIMVAFTEKKQGLHDKLASCLVIKTKPAHGILITLLLLAGIMLPLSLILYSMVSLAHDREQLQTALQQSESLTQQEQNFISTSEGSTTVSQTASSTGSQ